MAKVIFSPLVSSIRGRVGSFVAQGGPGGAMLRTVAAARPRQSPALAQAQRDMAAASRLWKTLTAEERALWAAIARQYAPASAASGLAFSRGRFAFIRYASQFLHFGLAVPTAPEVYPFSGLWDFVMTWDPDTTPGYAFTFGGSAPFAQLRIWAQHAPYWPQFSTRQPWIPVYDTTTDPVPTIGTEPGATWYNVPVEPFARLAVYGNPTKFRARISGIMDDDTVATCDDAYLYLPFF